jgi:hypothetical protein
MIKAQWGIDLVGGFSTPFSYSGVMMIPNEYLVGGLEHGFYFPQ